MLFSLSLNALQINQDSLNNKRLFGIEFPDGLQSFYGRHDKINSVSLQEYQAGPYSVTEVTIDIADSPLQLRLYHTELSDAKQAMTAADAASPVNNPGVPSAVQNIIDKGRGQGNAVQTPVIKDYPITTHAKTLEFRISRKAELQQFYRAFVQAFTKSSGSSSSGSDNTAQELAGTLFLIE